MNYEFIEIKKRNFISVCLTLMLLLLTVETSPLIILYLYLVLILLNLNSVFNNRALCLFSSTVFRHVPSFFIPDGIFKPFDVYQDSGAETILYVYIFLLIYSII